VTASELELGAVYPSLGRLRQVSVAIAVAVAENMFHDGRATNQLPLSRLEKYREGDRELLAACCRASMYTPSYDDDEKLGNNYNALPPYNRSRL
jgi:malic enzyme